MGTSNFYLWLCVEVILCGFLIPPFINFLVKKYVNAKKSSKKDAGLQEYKLKLSDLEKSNPNYKVLCSNKSLDYEYFRHNTKDAIFVLPFPETKTELLIENGFTPVIVYKKPMCMNKQGKELFAQFKDIIAQNGIPDNEVDAYIEKKAIETADKFITDIRKGRVRFNKYLYGVFNKPKQKVNECVIDVYESDYFTFKTVTNIYNDLKSRNGGKVKFGDNYAPFLNSFGVGGFVIVNRGKEDELIWGYRGSNCQSGGYWHFSYDETFTHDDSPNQDQAAELISCIKRALDEELGINREEDDKCIPKSQIMILDGGIIYTDGDDNRFEFELCSYVRVCFSEKYTIGNFIQNYRFAKDAELETRCLKLVKMSELEAFIAEEDEKHRISPEAKALALKIKCLYDLGLLPTDEEGYNEILASSMK